MTQEDKELLLKDLSARLQYGVKIQTDYIDVKTLEGIQTPDYIGISDGYYSLDYMECKRCKRPMDTMIAELNAIHYNQNFYACEHCGMLYSIYRPETVIYKPLGYWEDKTEDDWGKEVISDKEYKKKHPLYVPPTY